MSRLSSVGSSQLLFSVKLRFLTISPSSENSHKTALIWTALFRHFTVSLSVQNLAKTRCRDSRPERPIDFRYFHTSFVPKILKYFGQRQPRIIPYTVYMNIRFICVYWSIVHWSLSTGPLLAGVDQSCPKLLFGRNFHGHISL